MSAGDVMDRWMRLEMGRIMEGLVPAPRPLGELLRESDPKAPTRGKEPHRFDRTSLEWISRSLNPLTRAQVRLPLNVFLDHELPGDCYVADAASTRAMQELGVGVASPRDGRLWMSLPRVRDFAHQRPTLVQFVLR